MSLELNLRGVKRKLSTEAEDSVEPSEVEENAQRRLRVDNLSPLPSVSPPQTENDPFPVGPPDICQINATDKVTTTTTSPPTSLSSQSISDDDDDEVSTDDDDEDDDDDSEFVEDDSFVDQLGDESRVASAESESGYDERASSNSSLSDTTSNESEYAPILVSHDSSVSNFNVSSSVSGFSGQERLLSASSAIQNRNGLSDGTNASFCAYSMAQVNAIRSSPVYAQPSRSYGVTNNHNKSHSQYLRQRQQIFNLSLGKLSRFRQTSDPSLLRSVLICNTLRMLEKELEREGVRINFGPNGVSFISPVPSGPDLDFMPAFQSPPVPTTSTFDCKSSTDSSTLFSSVTSNENEPCPYPSQCESNADNCSEYDKYFSMENSMPSGRATPFGKNFTSNDYAPNRVSEQTTNSAFWTSSSDEQTDRLTSLNWSSMLSFSNSTASPNEISTDSHPNHVSESSSSSSPEALSPGVMMPYTNEQLTAPEDQLLNSSSSLAASSVATFATLLPPASTPLAASPSSESNPLMVSSAQISSSSSDSSYLLSAPNSAYYSTSNSSLPPFSSTLSPPITQQSCGTSSSASSHSSISVSLASTPSLMSTSSYLTSYHSFSATSDEIFGDIDLSLYDFDIFSPLSPPSVSNKSAPIMSAEELIRTVSSADCNGSVCPSSSSSISFSLNHYSVNGFSGQSYTSSSSSSSLNYCTSSSSMTNVISSLTTAASAINSQLMMSQTVSMPSPSSVNCGSSSTAASGLHLHTASGRYYKAAEERDQQTVATIKCHN